MYCENTYIIVFIYFSLIAQKLDLVFYDLQI